jgi:uncharacterized protein
VITEIRGGAYYATIHLSQEKSHREVTSRPSDAIALAVRANASIFANEDVLTQGSIVISDEDQSGYSEADPGEQPQEPE